MQLLKTPTASQRAVRRAALLLDAADGTLNAEIARETELARQHVIAIRRRFEDRGLDSVYNDAPGRGQPREITEAKSLKIITTTMNSVLKNATHWNADEMAQRFDVSSNGLSTLARS